MWERFKSLVIFNFGVATNADVVQEVIALEAEAEAKITLFLLKPTVSFLGLTFANRVAWNSSRYNP